MTDVLRRIRQTTGVLPLPGTVDARWPAIIERAGPGGRFAADEFSASVTNPHTRRAYGRVVGRFLVWCEARELELRQVTPGYAAGFIDDFDGGSRGEEAGARRAPPLLRPPGHTPRRRPESLPLRPRATELRTGGQDARDHRGADAPPPRVDRLLDASSASAIAP